MHLSLLNSVAFSLYLVIILAPYTIILSTKSGLYPFWSATLPSSVSLNKLSKQVCTSTSIYVPSLVCYAILRIAYAAIAEVPAHIVK